MFRTLAIAASAALLMTGLLAGAGSASAQQGGPYGRGTVQMGQNNPAFPKFERRPVVPPGPSPYVLPNPDARYGGRQPMAAPPGGGVSLEQIRANVLGRFPGRIVNSQLHGPVYSFRILSARGNIVDVDVDRLTGRILRSRGGP